MALGCGKFTFMVAGFCLLDLSIVERGMLMTVIVVEVSANSPFSHVMLCFLLHFYFCLVLFLAFFVSIEHFNNSMFFLFTYQL